MENQSSEVHVACAVGIEIHAGRFAEAIQHSGPAVAASLASYFLNDEYVRRQSDAC